MGLTQRLHDLAIAVTLAGTAVATAAGCTVITAPSGPGATTGAGTGAGASAGAGVGTVAGTSPGAARRQRGRLTVAAAGLSMAGYGRRTTSSR